MTERRSWKCAILTHARGALTAFLTRRVLEDREDGSVREALSQMNPNARCTDRSLSWDGRNGTERAFSGLAVQEAQARRCDTRNVPSAVRRRRYGGAVWEAGHPNGGLGEDKRMIARLLGLGFLSFLILCVVSQQVRDWAVGRDEND